MKDVIVIIPARLNATRLPGKALAHVGDVPMVRRVFDACLAHHPATYVATDSPAIACHIPSAHCIMTKEHHCGTERVGAACKMLNFCGYVINVQGDMPFFEGACLPEFANFIKSRAQKRGLATMVSPLTHREKAQQKSCVKVEFSTISHRCLWFTRAFTYETLDPFFAWEHVGVYGYHVDALQRLCAYPPTPMEERYALEQMRALEHGMPIFATPYHHTTLSVDTPDDLQKAHDFLQNQKKFS